MTDTPFSLAILCLLLLLTLPQTIATLSVATPTNAVQCGVVNITWFSGEPPYDVVIDDGHGTVFTKTNSTNVLRTMTWPGGTQLTITVIDGNDTSASSSPFTVESGSDTSCLLNSHVGGSTISETHSTSASSTLHPTSNPSVASSSTSSVSAPSTQLAPNDESAFQISSLTASSDSTDEASPTSGLSESGTSTQEVPASLTSSSSQSLLTSATWTNDATPNPVVTQSQTAAAPASDGTGSSNGLSTGACAGIAVATFIIMIGIIAILLLRRRSQRLQAQAFDEELESTRRTRPSPPPRAPKRAPTMIKCMLKRAFSTVSCWSHMATAAPSHMYRRSSNRPGSMEKRPRSSFGNLALEGEFDPGAPSGTALSRPPSGTSGCSVDGGVRLAGGRPGSDGAQAVPYEYAGPTRPNDAALPPPYASVMDVTEE